MSTIKLSICIPVYNNSEVLQVCLSEACKSILAYGKTDVEILVSDNASEEDVFSAVVNVRAKFPTVTVHYHRNEKNLGFVGNYLGVVTRANGGFCWVIGSDDFLMDFSVGQIMEVLGTFPSVDFFMCKFEHVNLETLELSRLEEALHEISQHTIPIPSVEYEIKKFKQLIHPRYENVFMGSVMVGIFRKSVWMDIDKESILRSRGYDTLMTIYPHCQIYASGFMNVDSIEIDTPLIIVGDGRRPWAADNGQSFWDSSLPLIFYTILAKMVINYKKFGLDQYNFDVCMKNVSKLAGKHFLPLLFQKIALKREVKDYDAIDFWTMTKNYLRYPAFFRGIASSLKNFDKSLWRR